MGFGVSTHATAEPAGQPHQVSVFERLIRSSQRPPPHPEPARIMAHAEIGVQNDAVDAIVAAAQQIAIKSAQPVRHGQQVIGRLTPASNCPAGATFSQLRLRKSVASFSSYPQSYLQLFYTAVAAAPPSSSGAVRGSS